MAYNPPAPERTFRYVDYDAKAKRARIMFGSKPADHVEAVEYIRADVVAEMLSEKKEPDDAPTPR